ncbi:MAG: sialate O-acetylesterase [Pirellulaceae bacterium]
MATTIRVPTTNDSQYALTLLLHEARQRRTRSVLVGLILLCCQSNFNVQAGEGLEDQADRVQADQNSQHLVPKEPEKFHLFLLAGQSNMAGRGVVESQLPPASKRMLCFSKDGSWEVATDPLHFDKPKLVGVGLGRTFAQDYLDAHPGIVIGLIPCAVGGSSVTSWTPSGFHEQTKSYPYDNTLEQVSAATKFGRLKGILWHQGESDSNAQRSKAYESNLARLIDDFRAKFDNPNLPFIIGQLGNFHERPWNDHRLTVDAAHKRLSDLVHNCRFVSSFDLGHKGDEVHFNSEAYRALGHRYFAAWQDIEGQSGSGGPEIELCSRIPSDLPHGAFTDLTRFKNKWYCAFREGQAHVSKDGRLRVIVSEDGQAWEDAVVFDDQAADLRDAKITVTPQGKLMVTGAAAFHDFDANSQEKQTQHQTYAWYSEDGRNWTERQAIGEPNYWLWRVSSLQDRMLGIGYRTGKTNSRTTTLYESSDGQTFNVLKRDLFDEGYPNESSIVFDARATAFCLLRRDPLDGKFGTAMLGRSRPPYTDWGWKDLEVRVGGPQMCLLPDGRLLAAVRLYDGHTRTSLCWVDTQQGRLREFLRLPSSGDTSYAGLAWHEDRLWVSYYSQHEALGSDFRSAVYVARIKLPIHE